MMTTREIINLLARKHKLAKQASEVHSNPTYKFSYTDRQYFIESLAELIFSESELNKFYKQSEEKKP